MSRALVLIALLAAAAALIVAERLAFVEVRVLAAVPAGGTRTGGAHHGYALAVVGAAMVPLALGAVLGRARAAAAALIVLSLVALGVVLAVDWPATDDTGAFALTYELARAHAREGLYVELAAACVALAASVAALAQSTRRTTLPRT